MDTYSKCQIDGGTEKLIDCARCKRRICDKCKTKTKYLEKGKFKDLIGCKECLEE